MLFLSNTTLGQVSFSFNKLRKAVSASNWEGTWLRNGAAWICPRAKQIQCVLEVLGSAAVSEGSWKFGKFQFPTAAKVQVFQEEGL